MTGLYNWITTTGANELRTVGIAQWESPTTGRRYAWDVTDGEFTAFISGVQAGRHSESAVRVVDTQATREHYESAMRYTAKQLADATVRLILDLDEALTDILTDTGSGEEIGTHGALRAMCQRRLGEPATVSFTEDRVRR